MAQTNGAVGRLGTAVLVHGGWHGPWCWDPIIPGLRAAGLSTVAVDLPMQSLEEDVAIARDAVSRAKGDGPVCLVGHSYGGQVVNGAGHDADRLVYVCAMAPDEGQSAIEAVGADLAAIPGLSFENDKIIFTRDTLPALYNRCDEATREWAFARIRPFGAACAAVAHERRVPWATVPATYVICTDDRAVPPRYQRERAALMSKAVELDADHSPFCSATDELVDVIVDCASSYSE